MNSICSSIVHITVITMICTNISLALFPIQISDFSCVPNNDYCANLGCNFITIRNRMQVLDFEVEFIRTLEHIMLNFKLYRQDAGGEYKPYIINTTENVCKFLDSSGRSNIISRLMPNWKHYGSFPKQCPVKGVVYLRKYPIDLSFFPSTIPAGDFRINVNLIEGNNSTSVLNTTVAFSVRY